jgi:hypothetical protein
MDLARKGVKVSSEAKIIKECKQTLQECSFITEAMGARTAAYVREHESRKNTLPPSIEYYSMTKVEKENLKGV